MRNHGVRQMLKWHRTNTPTEVWADAIHAAQESMLKVERWRIKQGLSPGQAPRGRSGQSVGWRFEYCLVSELIRRRPKRKATPEEAKQLSTLSAATFGTGWSGERFLEMALNDPEWGFYSCKSR